MKWFAFVESNTTGTGRAFCAAASAQGHRPVLLCVDPTRYPYAAEDHVATVIVDTSNQAAVTAACEYLADQSGLAGITTSSEYFVATAARAATKLGLPSPDPDAVIRCRDKAAQRHALVTGGVPVPQHRVADSSFQARAAATEIGTPVVVKPTDGSGSVGVRLCADPAEAQDWAATLLDAGTNERGMPMAATVLVEEYVDGPEFSVETFDRKVIEVVGKHVGPPPYFVEIGHDVPAAIPATDRTALTNVALSALSAIGLGWGAAHTELRMTNRGPVVIEVNPRLAGGMIPEVLRAAHGIDLPAHVVGKAAGLSLPTHAGARRASAIRFLVAPHDGTVTEVPDVRAVHEIAGIHAAAITVQRGDRITIMRSFKDRVGYSIAVAPELPTAVGLAETTIARLRDGIMIQSPRSGKS